MNGKEKCAILKNIRREIANKNDISLNIPECSHKGNCQGTCPRCEYEVRYLKKALDDRKKRGLKIAVAGISAGLIVATSASCDILDLFSSQTLQGDMIAPPELDGEVAVTGSVGQISTDNTESVEHLEGVMIAPETLTGDLALEKELVVQGDLPPEEYE